MNKAYLIHEYGGPEVLKWEDVEVGDPGPGEVRIRHKAVGLNFIDVYHRTGLYPLPALPAVPGMEGAGVVEAVGKDVTEFKPGDRVAYAHPPGAYSETRLIPEAKLVHLPGELSFEQGAAMMLKGMTARYLLYGCFNAMAGDVVLVHAAAGGVGQIVVQWAKDKGTNVIATVGSAEKAALATELGADHVINYQTEDFEVRVKEITGGKGVDAVYDGVGQATFMKSLDCLRPMGTMVSFGNASGPVEPFNIGLLATKGSLFLTRPSLMTYTATRDGLLAHARDLFEVVARGAVKISVGRTYPLVDAPQAHRDLVARKTTGSTILIP
ncbi:quinone oxidoreductase family protein [Desulfovibrio ferrophilus]|uniref:Nadph:quinone reductase, zeta-crystallin homolog protein n=1 Tax=Desulfovibrio ferrophilus TaxID=241368 RepID=A0A2Z6AW68_9BACT|nr:quinone oxidoreductase [Desulfovibrio ferrophilus]BBD07478.1 nadph:quinone reductase, zeta-crystallin homolog protein [Desulfovibrio ferrophilus]